MLRVLSSALTMCLLGLSLIAQTSPATLVIVNASIVDVAAGRARKVAALVIEGGRIAALHDGEPATLPAGAEKVDGSGLTLVPGLVDLAVQAQPSMDLDVDYFYALSLAHGVTTIRTVDARLVWAVQQRERVRTGAIVGPRIVTTGPLIDSRGADPLTPIPMPSLLPATVVGDTAAAIAEVTRQRAGRADWARFSSRVGADLLGPALPVARKSGLRVSAAPGAASMAQLAQLGVGAIDGLGPPVRSWIEYESMARKNGGTPDAAAILDAAWAGLSAAEQRTLVQRLVRARTPVVPMLRMAADRVLAAGDEGLAAERKLAPARGRAAADRARAVTIDKAARSRAGKASATRHAFVAALVRAGGRVGTASGASAAGWPVPGLGLQREMMLLVEAGLTPAEAIRAATVVSAEALGLKGVGQIQVGYRADLVGVRGDPLADIAALSNVALVVRDGERLDREALLRSAERATRVVK